MKDFLGYCFLYDKHRQIWNGVLFKDTYEILKKLIDNERFMLTKAEWMTAEDWDDVDKSTDLKIRYEDKTGIITTTMTEGVKIISLLAELEQRGIDVTIARLSGDLKYSNWEEGRRK